MSGLVFEGCCINKQPRPLQADPTGGRGGGRTALYLFQDPGRHFVATVEDHMELLGLLHLLQQGLGVLGLPRQLSDLQAEVVARGSLDQLLQADETCGERGGAAPCMSSTNPGESVRRLPGESVRWEHPHRQRRFRRILMFSGGLTGPR